MKQRPKVWKTQRNWR